MSSALNCRRRSAAGRDPSMTTSAADSSCRSTSGSLSKSTA
ncbi:hypothetical protein I553_8214 [Mycobacterium xenopi 4042]|uniref:Uncharacterized protein n=1 Tax=Mycobacterium xenopi 4042 TaxID=1299334 RepID=X8AJA1_MYCXE|nr:hypothetical protein I553_2760 [Mycobacterium xenopi 4042]EUA43880.1 hypothetical protein I553_8214 [Mycobacterium xenopi 4042]